MRCDQLRMASLARKGAAVILKARTVRSGFPMLPGFRKSHPASVTNAQDEPRPCPRDGGFSLLWVPHVRARCCPAADGRQQASFREHVSIATEPCRLRAPSLSPRHAFDRHLEHQFGSPSDRASRAPAVGGGARCPVSAGDQVRGARSRSAFDAPAIGTGGPAKSYRRRTVSRIPLREVARHDWRTMAKRATWGSSCWARARE